MSGATTSASASTSGATSERVRLDYLDGLRGLSALYVVFYHASDTAWADGVLPRTLLTARKLLVYGHFAVAVFIILSGYCLMLPVAREAGFQLRNGVGGFVQRRARRLLPPYYAVLLLTLLLIRIVPKLDVATGTYWDGALPAFTPAVLLSHLCLVHNLTPAWHFKINPPLWSVATEWQIYFFFPLLLLPILRRYGLCAMISCAAVLAILPHFILPSANNLDTAAPWYLSLFGIGMGAATLNFAQDAKYTRLRDRTLWRNLSAVQLALVLCMALGRAQWWWAHLWFADIQVGVITASLLIYLTQQSMHGQSGPLLTLLQARGAVLLGSMSYSLYLVHAPLLALFHIPLTSMHLSPPTRWLLMILVAVPLILPVTYLFHRLFERPFMNVRQQPTRRFAQADN